MKKILDCWWYSTFGGCIGIVKVEDNSGKERFYIDVVQGVNEEIDANMIAQYGAPFHPKKIK